MTIFFTLSQKCMGLFALICCLFGTSVYAQAPAAPAGTAGVNAEGGAAPGSPTFKLSGGAELMTNYVHRGLTETEKDPALQASFWFNFGPQFRLGLWGTNVGYEGSDTRFLLKMNADVKVNFSDTSHMIIMVSKNNYFKPEDRNGWTYGLHFGFSKYKVLIENETNWHATNSQLMYYAFGYEHDINEKWLWPSEVGYSQFRDDNYSNYFDFRTGIHYKSSVNIRYKLYFTGATNAGQFDGRAAYAFILAAQTEF